MRSTRRERSSCGLVLAASLVAGAGCVGHVGGGGGSGSAGSSGGASGAAGVGVGGATAGAGGGTSGATAGSGAGTSGAMATPGDLPLPRLARDEYIQTVRDLLQQVGPTIANQVLVGVIPLTNDLPADALVTIPTEKHGGFGRDDQSEQQQYSDVPIAVATALGVALTSTPARVAAVFGACSNAGASVDAACLRAFVKSFGEIALRHPLSDDDVTFYAGTALATPPSKADLANVIAVMLSSPRFLYRVESGAAQVSPNVYQLDAWELAARLSYHFWGTMPDAALRDAATSGALLTDSGYATQVDRLMADPRADMTLRNFFQQWFWPLLELPPLDSRASDPVFKAFAGTDLPGSALRAHMLADALDAASWVTAHGGGIADLLTNRLSFARDADLAAIYGVAPWSGQGDPPMLPAARVGLLTRAAFLSTGTANTRPIMKGVFIRTTLLCDTLPPPPPNAANTPIKSAPDQTTREVIESITEVPGTVCIGCHKAFINPLGFASENFDSLGRQRAAQAFFDDTGKMTGSKAVETASTPAVASSDMAPSTGIGDVTRLVAASGKVETCLATRFFRYAFRRIEGAGDQPAIDGLATLAAKGTLTDVFKGVALRPEFKQRVITP
jgi:hypothetical protein